MDAASATMLFEGHDVQRHGLAEQLGVDAAETSAAGTPASTEVRDGRAAHEILVAAGAYNADLIVVGTHHCHGLARLALGSVSRAVVRGAHASVLVVHTDPDGAPEPVVAGGTAPARRSWRHERRADSPGPVHLV